MNTLTAMPAIDTINGLSVVASILTPPGRGTRPGRVVLLTDDRPSGLDRFGRPSYIIAWQGWNAEAGCWDSGWHQGWYLDRSADVMGLFLDRARRNGGMLPDTVARP